MNTDSLNRLMVAISVIWLLFMLFRLVIYTTYIPDTGAGHLFIVVLNIVLIVGLLLMAFMLFRRIYPKMASKVDRDGRCPDCYGRIGPDDEFCPGCGRDLKR